MSVHEIAIPTNWAMASLNDAVNLNPRKWDQYPAEDELVSFVPMKEVEAGTGRVNVNIVRQWKEVAKGYTTFQNNDVLFAKITPCMENGKTAIALGLIGSRGAGSTEFHVLRPTGALLPNFLLHFLLQESFRQSARRQMKGTAGQLRVPQRFLEETSIPLPPLSEQRRIVAEIETQLTRLDASVAALKRAQASLKRYRASVLKAAFEGRLEIPVCEPLEELAGISLTQNPESSISNFPKAWDLLSLSEICVSIESGSTPPAEKMAESGDIPYIKVYNLTKNGALDFTVKPTFIDRDTHLKKLRRSIVLPNDVLMNIVGPPLGKVSIVPDTFAEWNTNQAVVVFRTSARLLPKFLCYGLLSDTIQRPLTRQAKATAGQFNISLTMCRNIPFLLPPLSEQREIVSELDRRLSATDVLEQSIHDGLKRANRLRQSILRKAFGGELVPQDPDDEPAGVLLERIKAERAVSAATKPSRKPRAKAGQLELIGE